MHLIEMMLLLFVCVLLASAAEACSDGAVRLMGGPNEFEGRVEVCLDLDEDESEWGRWCANGSVRTEETNVVCRQLHGSGTQSIQVENSVLLYGRGDSSVAVTNVSCGENNEDEITDCHYDVIHVDQLVDCDEVAVICSDPSCPTPPIRLVGGATSSEGLVDICAGPGDRYRAGLCYEEFTEDPEAAAVICTQLGYDTSNPRVSESELRFFARMTQYDCTGEELNFTDCNPQVQVQVSPEISCSSARLSCQDFEATSSSPTPTTTDTGQPSTSSTSDTLVTSLVVVCVVLVLLLAGSVVIIMVVLCTRRKRNKVTLQEPGMSNINYELGPKSNHSQEVVKDERTVSNDLYTASQATSNGRNGQLQPPPATHVYDYAAVGISRAADPSRIPQHTLLHSTLSTSDDTASHAYSKPTTPLSNYDRTVNHFQVGTQGHLPADAGLDNEHDYSKLSGSYAESHLDHSQGYSEVGDQDYSHIDDAHKYAKLSEANSKGYSQLNVTTHTAVPAVAIAEPHSGGQAFPYEVPFSPASSKGDAKNHTYATLEAEVSDTGNTDQRDTKNHTYATLEADNSDQRDSEGHTYSMLEDTVTAEQGSHAYSTVEAEAGDSGYSKLHVVEESQDATAR